jgi:hypothetical protein
VESRLALPALLAGLAVATAPAVAGSPATGARTIDGGTITVGRGAAGARLDMTRAQVVARLGKPIAESPNGVMSYQRPSRGIFDVYRYGDTKRVRMFIFSSQGRRWKLRDGNAIFAPGGIDRLLRHYGDRAKPLRDPRTGDHYYVIHTRFRHRPVETRFEVNKLSRKRGLVRNILLLFTDRLPRVARVASPTQGEGPWSPHRSQSASSRSSSSSSSS